MACRISVELFGNVDLQRRIDADRRPVRAGGTPMDDPHVFEEWQTGFGDMRFGVKANLMAPWRQQAGGVCDSRRHQAADRRRMTKGLGTGKLDLFADAIVSGEAARGIELSGYGGFYHRGDPDDYDLSSGFRWGFGAGFPSRSKFRVTTELHGEIYFDDEIVATGIIVGATAELGCRVPARFHPRPHLSGEQRLLHRLGRIVRLEHDEPQRCPRRVRSRKREEVRSLGQPGAHRLAPGRARLRRAAAAATAATAATSRRAANRPPTVKARCEPCVVEIGKTSTVTADAQDPDGDALAYKWSAPSGTFANPAERQTIFTCPKTPGSVPVTVTVNDGKGGTASDTITIQCVAPPAAGVEVRGRALRLRPLHAAAGSDCASSTRPSRPCRRTTRCG